MATLAEQLGFIPWVIRAVMMFVMDNILPTFVKRKMLESKGLSGKYLKKIRILISHRVFRIPYSRWVGLIQSRTEGSLKIFYRWSVGKSAQFEDIWWDDHGQTHARSSFNSISYRSERRRPSSRTRFRTVVGFQYWAALKILTAVSKIFT